MNRKVPFAFKHFIKLMIINLAFVWIIYFLIIYIGWMYVGSEVMANMRFLSALGIVLFIWMCAMIPLFIGWRKYKNLNTLNREKMRNYFFIMALNSIVALLLMGIILLNP